MPRSLAALGPLVVYGDVQRPVFDPISYGARKIPRDDFDSTTQLRPNRLRPGR